MTVQADLSDSIESMIDQHGLETVLTTVAVVCRLKAEHIYSNWQDETLGRAWDRCAKQIEGLSANATKCA